MKIPIIKDSNKALSEITSMTKKMKSLFLDVYAVYAIGFYSSLFLPYIGNNWFIDNSTLPYTLAFSNTPGLIKPLTLEKT